MDKVDQAMVYDLVEYKIARELDEFPPGSQQWNLIFRVLELYLEEKVNVSWSGTDMKITMRDGTDPPPDLFEGILEDSD